MLKKETPAAQSDLFPFAITTRSVCWPCCIWGHWFSQMLIAVCDHTNGGLPTCQVQRKVLLILEYNHLSHESKGDNESYTLFRFGFTFTFTILCDVYCVTMARKR